VSRVLPTILLGVSLSAVALVSVAAQAPEIEYGSGAELKGVTKIFVNTGEDLETRDNIVRIILRDLPGLTVTSRASDAEVILLFKTDESTAYAGTYSTGSSRTDAEVHGNETSAQGSPETRTTRLSLPIYQTTVAGSGKVFRITPEGHVRLILTYQGTKVKGTIWKKPRTKFAQKFIEAYRQANS
jgi:hypothetical protein